MVSLDDIAKKAGVSTATVSRVINGNFRTTTRNHALILQTIEELGYIPTKKISGKKNILIVTQLNNDDIVNEIEMRVEKFNCSTLYKFLNECDFSAEHMPERGGIDGIILCDVLMKKDIFDKLKMICPVVLCRVLYDFENTVSVSTDNETASYELTSTLLRRGRKKIVFLYDSVQHYQSNDVVSYELVDRKERLRGYKRALYENGLKPDNEFIISVDTEELVKPAVYMNRLHSILSDIIKAKKVDAIISTVSIEHSLEKTLKDTNVTLYKEIDYASFCRDNRALRFPYICVRQSLGKIVNATLMILNSMMRGELIDSGKARMYVEHIIDASLVPEVSADNNIKNEI